MTRIGTFQSLKLLTVNAVVNTNYFLIDISHGNLYQTWYAI